MDSGCLELSLSLKPCYVPQGISNILKDVSKIHNISDRLLVLNEYLQKYQEELSRLKDFQNELPQCVLLLLDAIEKLEEEVTKTKSAMPALEFLPKKSTEMLKMETFEKYSKEGNNIFKTPFPQLQPCKARIGEDAALTMRRCPTIPELSSTTAKARKPGKRIQALNALSNAKWGTRKISWKQPLHDRFVAAVELLGGPEVATPKRIKKLMKVEELTRDHIKSHLQKYRIEKRKAPAASTLLS